MRDYNFQFVPGYWITPDDQIYSGRSKKFLKLYYRNGSKNGRFQTYENGKPEYWTIQKVHKLIEMLEENGTIAHLKKEGYLK